MSSNDVSPGMGNAAHVSQFLRGSTICDAREAIAEIESKPLQYIITAPDFARIKDAFKLMEERIIALEMEIERNEAYKHQILNKLATEIGRSL